MGVLQPCKPNVLERGIVIADDPIDMKQPERNSRLFGLSDTPS